MVWNTYLYNCNLHEIIHYNVLKYREADIKKYKKKCKTKEEFEDKLRSDVMSQYWARCEYEIFLVKQDDRYFLKSLFGRDLRGFDVTDSELLDIKEFFEWITARKHHKDGVKIDVFDQLNFRWKEFVDYCWNFHHKWQRKKKEQDA